MDEGELCFFKVLGDQWMSIMGESYKTGYMANHNFILEIAGCNGSHGLWFQNGGQSRNMS